MKADAKTKANLTKLQNAVFVAMAAFQTIDKAVKNIETKVLAENEYFIDTDSNRYESKERILEPSKTFLMSDSDFGNFLSLRYAEILKQNLPVNAPEGVNPAEYVIQRPYEVALNTAQDNLLEFMKTITPKAVHCVYDSYDMDIRKEAIELSLKLKL